MENILFKLQQNLYQNTSLFSLLNIGRIKAINLVRNSDQIEELKEIGADKIFNAESEANIIQEIKESQVEKVFMTYYILLVVKSASFSLIQ